MNRHDEHIWRSDRAARLSSAQLAELTEASRGYSDWTSACSADACLQGRIACPTPDACRRPEVWQQPSRGWFADSPRASRAVGIALSFAVGALAWLIGTGQ